MRHRGGDDAVIVEQLVHKVRVVARNVFRLLHEPGRNLLHQDFADLLGPIGDIPLGQLLGIGLRVGIKLTAIDEATHCLVEIILDRLV